MTLNVESEKRGICLYGDCHARQVDDEENQELEVTQVTDDKEKVFVLETHSKYSKFVFVY